MKIRERFIEIRIKFPYLREKWDNCLRYFQHRIHWCPYICISEDAYTRHFSITLSYRGRMLLENIIKPPKPQVWKTKQVWHTYFDWSLGVVVDSHAKAIELEKKTGFERVTLADWKKESVRQKKNIDDDWERHIQKRVQQVVIDANAGRKFTHESRANREKIMKQYGMKFLPH